MNEILRVPSVWFTLVELIVVITILAVLATVGFLSLSGYSDDARTSVMKANVRTVYAAIVTESTTTGNSPRYYVEHDPAAAMTGSYAFVDGTPLLLTGGNVETAGTNYTSGNPKWDRLKMNPDKFKVWSVGPSVLTDAFAAYSTGTVSVGAVDVWKIGTNGRKRNAPIFQVGGISPTTKVSVVMGNYSAGTAAGLIRDASSSGASVALVDGLSSSSQIPTNCAEIKTSNPAAIDGGYWIDPDGSGTGAPFQTTCDMTTDGGGWTLLFNSEGKTFSKTSDGTSGDFFNSTGTNLSYSKLALGKDLLFEAKDGNIFWSAQADVSTRRDVVRNIALSGRTLKDLATTSVMNRVMWAGTTYTNLQWGSYFGGDFGWSALAGRELAINDNDAGGAGNAFVFGCDPHSNSAGWPDYSNYSGYTNPAAYSLHWPTNFRVWTR